MKYLVMGCRFILGLVFFVFGLMFFFVPPPAEIPPAVAEVMAGFMKTGYLLQLIKGTETICGVLLLLGKFQAFALVVLAPISLNIFLFHVFVDTNGLPVALAVVIMQSILMWSQRAKYQPLFS